MTQQQSNSIQSVRLPATVQRFGYVVVDPDLRLREASSSFQQLVGHSQIGNPLSDVLFAFVGMETTLTSIMQAELPYWYLQGVAHSRGDAGSLRYFDILTLPDWVGDGLFVIVRDVTIEKAITGRFVQQRNEAQLRARNHSRTQASGGRDAGTAGYASLENEARLQGLDETLSASTTAVIGGCLRLLESAPGDLPVTQRVLASSLEIDLAIAMLLVEAQTTQPLEPLPPLDFVAMVRDVVLAHQLWAETFAIEIDISTEEIPAVFGFDTLLRAAVALLFINRIHRSLQGGRIDLAVVVDQQGVLIKISGRGIASPAIAEHSGPEMYWQSQDMGASAADRATQSGLYLVRAVVSAHGGRFWTERHPGGKSDLLLWFPTGAEWPPSTSHKRELS